MSEFLRRAMAPKTEPPGNSENTVLKTSIEFLWHGSGAQMPFSGNPPFHAEREGGKE